MIAETSNKVEQYNNFIVSLVKARDNLSDKFWNSTFDEKFLQKPKPSHKEKKWRSHSDSQIRLRNKWKSGSDDNIWLNKWHIWLASFYLACKVKGKEEKVKEKRRSKSATDSRKYDYI